MTNRMNNWSRLSGHTCACTAFVLQNIPNPLKESISVKQFRKLQDFTFEDNTETKLVLQGSAIEQWLTKDYKDCRRLLSVRISILQQNFQFPSYSNKLWFYSLPQLGKCSTKLTPRCTRHTCQSRVDSCSWVWFIGCDSWCDSSFQAQSCQFLGLWF